MKTTKTTVSIVRWFILLYFITTYCIIPISWQCVGRLVSTHFDSPALFEMGPYGRHDGLIITIIIIRIVRNSVRSVVRLSTLFSIVFGFQ